MNRETVFAVGVDDDQEGRGIFYGPSEDMFGALNVYPPWEEVPKGSSVIVCAFVHISGRRLGKYNPFSVDILKWNWGNDEWEDTVSGKVSING